MSADVFVAYVEYRAHMMLCYPGASILSYRDWLDYGYSVMHIST